MRKKALSVERMPAGKRSVKSGVRKTRSQSLAPTGQKISSLPNTSGEDMTLYLVIDASLNRLENLCQNYKWQAHTLINGDLNTDPSRRATTLEAMQLYKNAILKAAMRLPPVKVLKTNPSAKPTSLKNGKKSTRPTGTQR